MMDSSIPSSILEGVPVPVDTSHLASQVVSVAAATAPPVHAISIQVGDLFPDMKAFRARLGLFGITNSAHTVRDVATTAASLASAPLS